MAYIASAMKEAFRIPAQNCIDMQEGSWNKSQPTFGASSFEELSCSSLDEYFQSSFTADFHHLLYWYTSSNNLHYLITSGLEQFCQE